MSKNILAQCWSLVSIYLSRCFLSLLSVRSILSRRRFRNFEIQKLREKILERRLLEDMRDMKFSIVREIFFEVLSAFIVQFLFFYLSTLNISSILSLIVFSFVLISIFFLRLRNAYHNFFEIIEKD